MAGICFIFQCKLHEQWLICLDCIMKYKYIFDQWIGEIYSSINFSNLASGARSD